MNDETQEVIVTEELLLQGRSGTGGWTKAQLAILGINWPPTKGWKEGVVGKVLSVADAQRFLAAKKTKKPKSADTNRCFPGF